MKKKRRDEGSFWKKRERRKVLEASSWMPGIIFLSFSLYLWWLHGLKETVRVLFFLYSRLAFLRHHHHHHLSSKYTFTLILLGLHLLLPSHYLLILACLWFDNNSRERCKGFCLVFASFCFLSFGNIKSLLVSCHKKRWQTKEKMRERVKHLKKDKIPEERMRFTCRWWQEEHYARFFPPLIISWSYNDDDDELRRERSKEGNKTREEKGNREEREGEGSNRRTGKKNK